MESYAEAIGMMEKFDPGSSSHSALINVPIVPLFDRLLSFVEGTVEYAFGILIGSVVGWLLGEYSGNIYVEHFEAVYFSDLSELRQWGLIPCGFAKTGAIIGAAAGAITIAVITRKLLRTRIVSLYKEEVTKPKDIARVIGRSEKQIQRVIKKLATKGEIVCQKTTF
ncbi:MAG: helix-turn-helix domain-containing protein [Planctomycetota bacterium]|jgi:hypothetical protein